MDTPTHNEAHTAPDPVMSADAELAALLNEASEVDGGLPPEPGQEIEAAPKPQIPTAVIIQPVIALACSALAPAWDIQAAEQQTLAEAYGEVIDKYFPGGLGSVGPELSALLVTGAILAPRLGKPRHPEPEKKPELQAESASTGEPEPDTLEPIKYGGTD